MTAKTEYRTARHEMRGDLEIMDDQQRQTSVTNKVYIILSVAMTCMKGCRGCFPLDDLFIFNRDWKQQTSLHTYTVMSVGKEADDMMKLDYYRSQTLERTALWRCLIAYGENRYLVRIESEAEEDILYRCVQFEALTHTIFQMSQTVSDYIRKKVNCIDDAYTEDQSVWFAKLSYMGVSCPLTGGYQLIVDADNLSISPNCLDSIYTYNPRFQFQCDNAKSGNVVLEMGDACEFQALVNKVQILKRNIVFFRCMGHWSKGSATSLLLQMQENENQVWCLQYQKTATLGGFMRMVLSLEGNCSRDSFVADAESKKSNSTVFGALASFAPANDPRCENASSQSQCTIHNVCLTSDQCPSQCNRCKKGENFTPCKFDAKFRGRWKPISSHLDYIYISVDVNSISGYYGEFTCKDHQGQDVNNMLQYSLVQTGSQPSCMPFYACLTLKYLSPGILFFEFRPVMREQSTGNPYSCPDASEKWGHLNLMKTESPLTLFNTSKLVKTGCNFHHTGYFRTTHQNCRLVVHKCTGSCTSLNASLEYATCSNETIQNHPMQTSHVCLGTVHFQDSVYGILTTNKKTSRYLCWVFANTRLFIATPEECNQKSVSLILNDVDALTTYDPLARLAEPAHSGVDDIVFRTAWVCLFSLLLHLILYV
ncbi:hypothetical protein Btru_001732 [Bulinus truncatus]|nr:hypothetical protein Btru_001732 [Bulinus truncatus]